MDLQKKKDRWVEKYEQLTGLDELRTACQARDCRKRLIRYQIDEHSLVLEADDSWYSKLSRVCKSLTYHQVPNPSGGGFYGPAIHVLAYMRDSRKLQVVADALASGKLRYETGVSDCRDDPYGRGHH